MPHLIPHDFLQLFCSLSNFQGFATEPSAVTQCHMNQPALNWEMYLWQRAGHRDIGCYVSLQRQLPRKERGLPAWSPGLPVLDGDLQAGGGLPFYIGR